MKIFVLFSLMLLISCAHLATNHSLYTNYSEYKKSVSESKLVDHYNRYFDPKLTESVDVNDPSVKAQLEFSNYMTKEINHFEDIENSKGCLTVNGVDSDGSAIAFYIQYNKSNEKWLISDIDVSFLENQKKYEKKALCPEQVRVK